MANDFDQCPLYDPITRKGDMISDIWIDFFSNQYMTLIGYLSQFGMFLPQITTEQRNNILSPQSGQLIYNTTIGSAQYFNGSLWITF